MSSTVTIRQSKGVRGVGLLTLIAGIVMILAGGVTWWAVSDKLSQEGIVVSEDAAFLGGHKVNDPFTAFAQADIINTHALKISDGLTYAELEKDDPRRDTVMNASFLRASLFTSVVSFGIAALVIGLGVLFILVGWALRRLAGGPPVVVETSGGPGGAHSTSSGGPTGDAPVHRAAPPTSTTPVTPPVVSASVTPPVDTAAPVVTPVAPTVPPVADPVRVSRADRTPSPSPAPAGERPTATPPATPAAPSEADEKPTGWASPADRVPPAAGPDEAPKAP